MILSRFVGSLDKSRGLFRGQSEKPVAIFAIIV